MGGKDNILGKNVLQQCGFHVDFIILFKLFSINVLYLLSFLFEL